MNGYIKSDESAVEENDLERINELVENGINLSGIKILENEMKKVVRG